MSITAFFLANPITFCAIEGGVSISVIRKISPKYCRLILYYFLNYMSIDKKDNIFLFFLKKVLTNEKKSVIISKSQGNAGMAQSVEHVIGNDEVISSILITSSKIPYGSTGFLLFLLTFSDFVVYCY